MPKVIYPWLQSHWQELVKQHNQKRLPHAMIFAAPEGLGVLQLVSQLSQLLLCKNPVENSPCGQCTSCELLKAGSHPDLHSLTVEDKKTVITVDQVRDLIATLSETAHQSGYRIAVIQPAHLMNKASANALLKTLEEPGSDTLLILITERVSALPATVRSRCLIVNISAPSEEVALDFVQENYPDNTKTDLVAVRMAQNRPLQALEILKSGTMQERQDFFAYLQGLSNKRLEPTSLYNRFNDKNKLLVFCDWMLGLVSDCEKHQAGIEMSKLQNSDQHLLIEALDHITIEQRFQWHKSLLETKRVLLSSSNINPKLLLDDMLLNWIAFFR